MLLGGISKHLQTVYLLSLIPSPILTFQCCMQKRGRPGRQNYVSAIAHTLQGIELYTNRSSKWSNKLPSDSLCYREKKLS